MPGGVTKEPEHRWPDQVCSNPFHLNVQLNCEVRAKAKRQTASF
jgi:hypothetical protein